MYSIGAETSMSAYLVSNNLYTTLFVNNDSDIKQTKLTKLN